jgi:geranylgeranyl reductase family protein
MDFDVVVVGAGPAGCSAAYDLVKLGRSVLVIDRSEFPRLKACAGAITIKAYRALRYPIDPIIRRVCTDLNVGYRTERISTFKSNHPICVMTVRSEFDAFCLQQTINAGAQFAVIKQLLDVSESGDGVVIKTSEGLLRSRFVIGADGANSRIRQLINALPEFERGLALEAKVPHDAPHTVNMEFDFGAVSEGYGWVFPKHDHLNVGLYTNRCDLKLSKDLLRNYVLSRVKSDDITELIGHSTGLGGWRYSFKFKRVFLVGDAAGLVDPLLGEGIYNAIKSGQLCAEAISTEFTTTDGIASVIYLKKMASIQSDLRSCHRSASKFYSHLSAGYGALTSTLARASLMRGFAAGKTFGFTKRYFFLLPFVPLPGLPSLQRFLR